MSPPSDREAASVRPVEPVSLLEAISDARERLAHCGALARSLNLKGPSVFIEGARGSLRHASTEVQWAVARETIPSSVARLREYGVGLRRSDEGRGVAVRQRLSADGTAKDDPTADGREDAPLANLVVDLLNDEAVTRLVRRPVFAGLLSNALARHAWLQRSSRTIWSEGAGTARMAVSILAGGRHFPDLSHADLGGLVDGEVAAALARSGWVRLDAPKPPGWNATPGS